MSKFLKNRNLVITSVVVLVVLVGLVGFFLISRNSKLAQDGQNNNILPSQIPVPTILPEEIGLTLTVSADMHKATMVVTKTEGITSLDYQLLYNADVSGEKVPRGTIGHVDIKTKGKKVSQDMIFGTCSDVCHYDENITDIKLIVKITKTDGKAYQAELTPNSSE